MFESKKVTAPAPSATKEKRVSDMSAGMVDALSNEPTNANNGAAGDGERSGPGFTTAGWAEQRAELQKDTKKKGLGRRTKIANVSLRAVLAGYIALTLAILGYETAWHALFLLGKVENPLDETLRDVSIPESERASLDELKTRQFHWIGGQLIFRQLGLIFCLFGAAMLYFERIKMLRVFQIWLVLHTVTYIAGAIVFDIMSPITMPGYVVVTLGVALLNLFALRVTNDYRHVLLDRAEALRRYEAGKNLAKDIAGPV